MKKMRRFAAIAAAAAMTACMAVPMMGMMTASASDYVITVNSAPTGMTNAEYVAYKILNVSYNEAKTAYTYSVPETGGVLTEAEILTPAYNGSAAFTTMDDLYTWLNDATNKEANARTFADTLYTTYSAKFVEENGTASSTGSIDTGSAGYYLVTGTVTDTNSNSIVSSVILTTMDPTATISPKLGAPTHDKEIYHNEEETWGDVGDNQIGDTVNYRITTTMPDTDYVLEFGTAGSEYVYTIHDHMTKGLDFDPESVVVTLGGTTLTADTHYTVTEGCTDTFETDLKAGQTAGDAFEVEFDMAAILADANLESVAVDGATFVTAYSCTLTIDALVASSAADDNNSNDNTSYLQYSNNPYDTTSTAETVEVTVYDWTFTFDVTKYMNEVKEGNELEGAGFKIYEGSTALKFKKLGDSEVYAVDPSGTVEEIVTTAGGTFRIVGLDDATTYKIVENTVPSGYNKAEDVEFTISDKYTGTPEGREIDTLKSNLTDEELNVDIINKSGTTLPSTGGIGTTLFYVIGGTLAAGAGVALIAKKRMKNEE